MVGRLVPAKLGVPDAAVAVGQLLTIEGRPWRVSGRFAAPGTLLEAELWCRLDDLKSAMRRPNDVSIVAMRFSPAGDPAKQMGYVDYFCRNRRPDLELMGSREADYYAGLQQALRADAVARVAAGGARRSGRGVRRREHDVRGRSRAVCGSSPPCRRSASPGARSRSVCCKNR